MGNWNNYNQDRKKRNGDPYNHAGNDYYAPRGTPIPAASAGTVVYSGWINGYGWSVIVESQGADGTKYQTTYGHQDVKSTLKEGQKVEAGDPVGYVGSTGNSSGPHVDVSIRITIEGKIVTVNPNDWDNWGGGWSIPA
jgi:murein DD-endopeptidase MepM/ murein hydrolase activator NlpD